MITRRALHEDRPSDRRGYENFKDPGDNLASVNAFFMVRHSFGPLSFRALPGLSGDLQGPSSSVGWRGRFRGSTEPLGWGVRWSHLCGTLLHGASTGRVDNNEVTSRNMFYDERRHRSSNIPKSVRCQAASKLATSRQLRRARQPSTSWPSFHGLHLEGRQGLALLRVVLLR